MRLLKRLLESYLVILLTAISVALIFPDISVRFRPFATLFLQIIFFLSSLKLDLHAVKEGMARPWPILLANLYTLAVFPIVTFVIAKAVAPDYVLPLLILAAMPAGMTSMLLTELVGGSVTFALLVTMTTSLLAPFSVPAILQLLAGASVAIPAADMMLTLLKVIVIPFALAQIIRHLLHERIRATFFTFKPISMALLGLLILGIVGKEAVNILAHLGEFAPSLAVLVVFFFLLHLAGYFAIPGLRRDERLAAAVCLTYMNFTLAIYLTGKYFPDPKILIPVVLSVFPWSIGIIPFKAIITRNT